MTEMGNTVSDSKVKAALAATVELYYRTNKIVGIIAGAFPAGTAGTSNYWLFAEGTMRGPNSTPPDRKTMWQLGSVTKTFTATLLAGAASEGRLALDTTVQSLAPSGAVIPAYSTYQGTTEIRLLDLATHTAGLPQDPPNVPAGGYTPSDMYRYLRGYALAVRPGEGWNYSNLGYGLLSNVLVNLDDLKGYGALFDELKRKGKFELPDTVLDPKPEQRTRLAWGYDATGARAPWRTVTWPAFDGSGALYSTIDDAMVWLSYNLGALSSPLDPLLPVIQAVYFKDRQNVMALGWQYYPLAAEPGMYLGKGGLTNGFSSFVGLVREQGVGVAILCNSSAAWPQTLGAEMLQILTQAPLRDK
ncbi:D-alanyl-D-alanine-carboxypeptidase/D-alanyl-D-alanine-endopeptidase [Bradyrhizobium liaoningense]